MNQPTWRDSKAAIERELGSGGMATVYLAKDLKHKRKVAVKVLYPGIRDVVRTDMRVIKEMVRVYKWFVPVENIEAVHSSLVDLLRRDRERIGRYVVGEQHAVAVVDQSATRRQRLDLDAVVLGLHDQ